VIVFNVVFYVCNSKLRIAGGKGTKKIQLPKNAPTNLRVAALNYATETSMFCPKIFFFVKL
jgi:hypothetical protein